MKTDVMRTYSEENNSYKYNMINGSSMRVKVESNKYNIPLDTLFTMANRKNPNRSFLFVSKVLGKHIPMNPWVGLLGNRILAAKYMDEVYNVKNHKEIEKLLEAFIHEKSCKQVYEDAMKNLYTLPEPAIFIGFAETATGLAQGIFSHFKGNSFYTHTTREVISDISLNIRFQEEHSHAKDHICYGLRDEVLLSQSPIVLIDDELTTGKTSLNIIRALEEKYPRKHYIVLSILDWRHKEDINRYIQLEKELDISIKVISLVSGTFEIQGDANINLSLEIDNKKKTDKTPMIDLEYLSLDEYFDNAHFYTKIDGSNNLSNVCYLNETGRFGLHSKEQYVIQNKALKIGEKLKAKRTGVKTLCLGTEEFIYVPMLIAAHMGEGVKFHSTTRSPIHPFKHEGYGAKNGFSFSSPSTESVLNYIYNIPYGYYDDLFLILEREVTHEKLSPLLEVIKRQGIKKVFVVFCCGIDTDPFTGSYKKEDVVFLLKNLKETVEEIGTEDREEAIQSGVHYSEMLPLEYRPTDEYMKLFYKTLDEYSKKVAIAVGVVAEKILKKRGRNIVLVSLARAGTPIGILIKRYLEKKYGINLPHYSVSIIRGKGIDQNAITYILKHHPKSEIQFIDGWTGKGAISKVLIESCQEIKNDIGIELDPDLAVLADPAYSTSTFGTREDFLIPSACLNATVSGLVSRTVHREDLIGPMDFHGAKYYDEMQDEDVSNLFIDRIAEEFPLIEEEVQNELKQHMQLSHEITWKGLEDIKVIQESFGIEDINLIKPGIGETTRVLLRRVPWKILVRDYESDNLEHILLLAKDRGVTVEEYPHMTYECCGLIRALEE